MTNQRHSDTLTFQELKASDAPSLQAVYSTVPAYYALLGGLRPDEALKAITESPDVDAPHYAWGIYQGETLVGHLDFILGYPESVTAYLGLLLIRGDLHGQGLGRAAFERWLAWVMAGPFRRVRLGVVMGNRSAAEFWAKVGCMPTGETRPLLINDHGVQVDLWEYAF